MHIVRLREKLGDDSEEPEVILTVRGQGYMLRKGNDEGRKTNDEGMTNAERQMTKE
jgi:DNA-binding winged helix-turn-helix (wHTH) protein